MSKVTIVFALEEAMNVQRYSSTLSLTSALDRDGRLRSRSGRFTPGKETRYQLSEIV
jgi:hypothetical protein